MERTFYSIDGLRQALTNIAAYPPDADPDVELRVKAALQLAAVLTFFDDAAVLTFVDDDPSLAPLIPELRELKVALFDVLRGRHVSWLEPAKKAGRPPGAIENAHLRGRYAAVADFLIDPGELTENQAVNLVGRYGRVERLMPKPDRSAPNHELVRDWRQAALANAGRDQRELRDGFDHLRRWMERQWRCDPGNPKAKAKQWLKVLDNCSVKNS